MFDDAFPVMIGILAVLLGLPLGVLIPLFVYRSLKLVHLSAIKGPQFSPAPNMRGLGLFLYIWLVVLIVTMSFILGNFGYKAGSAVEATTNLGAIYTAEWSYFGERNTFAGRNGEDGNGAFADMGWSPGGLTRYSYYVGGDYIRPSLEKFQDNFEPIENYSFNIGPEVTEQRFNALAVGNIDDDPCLDVWMVSDNHEQTHWIDDAEDNIENAEGTDCTGKLNMTALERSQARRRAIAMQYLQGFKSIFIKFNYFPAIMIFLGEFGLYYFIIRQNRLYHEALAATKSSVSSSSAPKARHRIA
jgi:hypothetical protein